jgi:hypothetical protein
MRRGAMRRTYVSLPSQPAVLRDAASLTQGPLYSEELGIDLGSGREQDLFLWLLANLLFGQRIYQVIARNTYHSFVRHGLTSPQ